MFSRLRSVRVQYGVPAATVVGAILVIWAVLGAISNIDTARALLNQKTPHWFAQMIEVISSLPVLNLTVGFAGLCALVWAIFELRRSALRPSRQEPEREPQTSRILDELGPLYRAEAHPTWELATRLLDRVCDLHLVPYERPATTGHYLAVLVKNRIQGDADRNSRPFTNALQRIPDTGFEDDTRMQQAFGEYHRGYLDIRTWALLLAELAGTHLAEFPEYQEWREHEREYYRRLRDLISYDRFIVLREKVEQAGWGATIPDAQSQSPLQILFDPLDRSCLEESSTGEVIAMGPFRHLRVGVRNTTSSRTVEGVRLVLERLETQGAPQMPFLLFPDQGKEVALQGVAVNPLSTQYFSVVSRHIPSANYIHQATIKQWSVPNPDDFFLHYAGTGYPSTIKADQKHGLHLRAEGKDVSPVHRSFILEADRNGLPVFSL